MPGSSGGRWWEKRSQILCELQSPELRLWHAQTVAVKFMPLKEGEIRQPVGVRPLSWPDPVLPCFLCFFWANHHVIHGASAWTPSKLWPGMMGLMVLQRMHGWKLRKYSLTWLRLLVGSMEARGELGLWLLRILCVWNGPLRRSETLSKSDNLCWALPLLLFFLDFTFSPQRAKDIYRNIQ